MMDGMGMMMWFSFLLGLFLIVVVGVVAVVTWLHSEKSPIVTHQEDAVAILNTRYAKGEMSKDEYEKIKTDIE